MRYESLRHIVTYKYVYSWRVVYAILQSIMVLMADRTPYGKWQLGWGEVGAIDYFSKITPNLDNVDPFFVDEADDNYSLPENSPAIGMSDFQPIPYNRIGREGYKLLLSPRT